MSTNNGPTGMTSLSAWLEAYETVTLPSGKVVGLRQADILALLMPDGRVPNVLAPLVETLMTGKAAATNLNITDTNDLAAIKALFDRVTRTCLVFPRIVDEAAMLRGEGITVEMVSFDDKTAIFNWAAGGRAALAAAQSFPDGPAADLDAVRAEQDVRGKAEPPAADSK